MKKKSLYSHFLGFLIKKGKKNKAKNILNKAFKDVSIKLNKPMFVLLTTVFLKLNCFVEVRQIRMRRAIHFIPFLANFKRRTYLTIKWLFKTVLEDKRQISFEKKIVSELTSLINDSTSKSLNLKKKNLIQALQNKSNLHFRW